MHVLECTPNICTYFNVFEHFLAQIDRTPKKTVPLGRAKPYPHHFKPYPWGEQNRTPTISNSTPGASKTVPPSFQTVPLGRAKPYPYHFKKYPWGEAKPNSFIFPYPWRRDANLRTAAGRRSLSHNSRPLSRYRTSKYDSEKV